MSSLQELKIYTKSLSVLYVEDSTHLLKQVGIFLEKIFKKVYTAEDGLAGLESYKLNKQDIVLTDLTMPNINGYEMIKELQKIDEDLKIVIISAHSDSINLLEAIHLGVCDFIPKPIDNKLLIHVLYKISKSITNNMITCNKIILNNSNDMLEQLKVLSKTKKSLEFINHYKGVPIIHKGYIIEFKDKNIVVYIPYIQVLSIAFQKYTEIQSEELNFTINASLVNIEKKTREVVLTNLTKNKFSSKNRKTIRVQTDDKIKVVPYINNKKLVAKIGDISINSVLLEFNNLDEIILEKDQEIHLHLGITLFNLLKMNKIEKNEIVYVIGKIFKIEKQDDIIKITVIFELNLSAKSILHSYIQNREVELIKEFKQLKNRYLV